MKNINVGDRVTVSRNFRSGHVVGKIQNSDKTLFHVRIIDTITKKSLGTFVYTEKQLISF
ncbi:MAG: hypothetical protein UHN47_03820 [Lachnospiraceae bacterium]|nr:hypothetical protein [Lachnospiraceae bacterium]